ncbi:MAG: DNA-formamidopyrimidine glycosylase [Deltaproteobacteria bacterium]|jgi:formamidopyrimidine-DNA glycosylase|nr:DNA-formamidopyrimidine glycosylase [Deltaproteobacteria bacterium]
MPELPEAQTTVDDLRLLLAGRRIRDVLVKDSGVLGAGTVSPERFRGRELLAPERLGKAVLLPARGSLFILASLRMTGQFLSGPLPEKNPLESFPRHVRLALRLEKNSPRENPAALFFRDQRKFGRLYFFDREGLSAFLEKSAPGPDALTIDPKDFHERLSRGRAPVKNLLLQQKLVSGLGNIYATEALFAAGISPERPGNELSLKESALLLKKIKEILLEAVSLRGSTVKDYRAPLGPGSYQTRHQAYGKAGEKCPLCGRPFKKIALGGRGTVFCPGCQK